jgi:hypothetical protein
MTDALAADAEGNFALAGTLGATNADFDEQTLSSAGTWDVLALSLDADGAVRWSQRLGGRHSDVWVKLALGPEGDWALGAVMTLPGTIGDEPLPVDSGVSAVIVELRR